MNMQHKTAPSASTSSDGKPAVESVTKFTYLGSDVVSGSSSTLKYTGASVSLIPYYVSWTEYGETGDSVWIRNWDSTRPLFNPCCCMDLHVDSDLSQLGPTADFSHEGTTPHPEHKVIWLHHQWFCSDPDKADGSTSHHSWEKTLIARTWKCRVSVSFR